MNMAGPHTSGIPEEYPSVSLEQSKQAPLTRFMPREEYLKKAREVASIEENLKHIDRSNHSRIMGHMDIENKTRKLEKLDAQLRTSAYEKFASVNVSDMSNFLNLIAENALMMKDENLAREAKNMGKREAEGMLREYPLINVFTDEARLCEDIALYLSNRYEEPALIKLDFADKTKTYYPRYGNQAKQEIPEKVALLYNLFGIGNEVGNIPEFTKEAKSSKPEDTVVPSKSFLFDGLSNKTVGTFIFIRPHTIPAEEAQKEKYVPAQVGLQLNQLSEDQTLPEIPSISDKKHSVVVLPDFQPKIMREGALRWY